jgi:DNA-binding LytR/AlgR family response regulator
MQEIRAIIADDEKQLRSHLKSMLFKVWPDLIICGEARNGREALELIEKHRPDIAFLDIRMPGLSGMEVAGKVAGSCWVVFVTAYDQYAIEAFEN